MAISIVHITTASLTNSSFTVNIPAATAGNTMIVSATTVAGSGPSNFIDHVVDSDSIFPFYSQTASGTRANDSGLSRTTNVFYRTNLTGGETQVFVVPNNNSGMNMYVVVYEVSGINYALPVEHNSVTSSTDSGTTTTGPTIATSFTNALYITAGVRGSAASWPFAAGAGFTQTFTISAGVSTHTHGYKIASGSNTISYTHATGSAVFLSGLADFNPTPNPVANMMLLFI
jgi:hypothetical protein